MPVVPPRRFSTGPGTKTPHLRSAFPGVFGCWLKPHSQDPLSKCVGFHEYAPQWFGMVIGSLPSILFALTILSIAQTFLRL